MNEGPAQFPNVDEAMVSTIPVVTTLLAGLSSAAFLVPLSTSFPSRQIRIWTVMVTSGDAAIALGTVATFSFVLATVLSLYTVAQNLERLPKEKQEALLSGLTEKRREATTEFYKRATHRYYHFAVVATISGLTLYALTLGTLIFPHLPMLGLVGSASGAAVSFVELTRLSSPPDLSRRVKLIHKLVGVALLITGLALLVGMLAGIV